MMKKGEKYKGFTVLDAVQVEDCDSTGIWLKHDKMGMEVFHLLNKDEENLFAFAFRTPVCDNMGEAHVLEHSVLCGSKKYPLKDPFIRLANQSVNTYLNAYTSSDHTVFPASSILKADYFNLFSVYADAVFFPLLKPEIFLQECHRIEFDEKKQASIQGVVYNEMKGNYSSYESMVSQIVEESIMAGTNYSFDSGGNPLFIPDLTLAKLKAFHKKFYCPANCQVFLYGSIPTKDQLDFLVENVLDKIKTPGQKAIWPKVDSTVKIKPFVSAQGPADEDSSEKKCSSIMAWRMDAPQDRAMTSVELLFLGELLWGDDCAPVLKALLDSGLGEDIAPQTGESIAFRFPFLSCGLRGCLPSNAKKIQKIIIQTLKDIKKNGISKDDIERTCMSFDFSNREIKRFEGPYSLVLLRRCLRGWIYGEKPWNTLLLRKSVAQIKQNIQDDPEYISSLIDKYLLNNKDFTLVNVTPSSSWSKKRLSLEKKLIQKKLLELPKDKHDLNLARMHDFQNEELSEKEDNIIPRLKLSDLSSKIDTLHTKISEIDGITVFSNTEATNGIVYVDVAYPADTLPAKDYPLLPSMAECIPELGWGGAAWHETLMQIERCTGGFGAYTRSSKVPDCSSSVIEEKLYAGRDWVIFHFKALEENAKDAFNLLANCLTQTDFSDKDRLKDLITGQYNSAASTLVSSAHWYASYRASCTVNRVAAINEIWDGLSALITLKKLSELKVETLASRYKNVFARLKKGGGVIHITSDSKGLSLSKKILPQFIKTVGLTGLKPKWDSKDSDFFKLTELSGKKRNTFEINEVITIPGTVGFASFTFGSAPFDTKECVADEVFSHYLATTELWKQIRTIGGAYGVFMNTNSDSNFSRFNTYRDPKPFDSLKALKVTIDELCNKVFTVDEVEKAIIGCYADEVTPKTPGAKGATGFLWELYGLNNAQKQRRLKWLLKITPDDFHKAAIRFSESMKAGRSIVLCPSHYISTKIQEMTGKIIKLPL